MNRFKKIYIFNKFTLILSALSTKTSLIKSYSSLLESCTTDKQLQIVGQNYRYMTMPIDKNCALEQIIRALKLNVEFTITGRLQ